MLIAKDFVLLNFPKTGSTFARGAIKQLYNKRMSTINMLRGILGIGESEIMELLMPKIDEAKFLGIKDQHGTLRQIPDEHRNKKIISVVRNPFSRYESSFFYRWWAKYPPTDSRIIRERYPSFPKLSFSEYYEMIHIFGRENRLRGIVPKIDLGVYSIQFIQFFFNDPESVLNKIDDDYIDNGEFQKDMGSIHFLHQESLREELIQFLEQIGISPQELDFINFLEKANISLKEVNPNNQGEIVDQTIKQTILEREKLIFKIFPEYRQSHAPIQSVA
jgi:hypothetical protein